MWVWVWEQGKSQCGLGGWTRVQSGIHTACRAVHLQEVVWEPGPHAYKDGASHGQGQPAVGVGVGAMQLAQI